MTKQEFLEMLRISLNGKILPGQVVENLQYYEDYINTEMRKGATEEEVLSRLGSHRLIARTIVETQGTDDISAANAGGAWYEDGGSADGSWHEEGKRTADGRRGEREDSDGWYGGAEDAAWYDREEYQPYEQPGKRHLRLLARVPVWAWVLLVFLIIVLVVSAVFSLLAALLPIVLPVLIVLFVVKAFRDWIH